MKVLIWVACILGLSLVQVLLKDAGIVLGAIPSFILFFGMWKIGYTLCKKYDEKKAGRLQQKTENTTSYNAFETPNEVKSESSKIVTDYNEVVREDVDSSTQGYYFASQDEFLIYVMVEKPKTEIRWLSGDKYAYMYKTGYNLVDTGNLEGAINYFQRAISLNPVAIDARFELIQCYLKLKRFDDAMLSLHHLERYLGRKRDIAKYYRCFGYYFVEDKDYERAAASYQLSLDFETHPVAIGELSVLCKRFNIDTSSLNLNILVNSGGAAILTPWFDDLQSGNDEERYEPEEKPAADATDEVVCPQCHRILPKDSDFCQYCGASVNKTESSTQSAGKENLIRAGVNHDYSKGKNETKAGIFLKNSNTGSLTETRLHQQNKLLFIVIGVLAAIIIVLVSLVIRGKQENQELYDTKQKSETSSAQVTAIDMHSKYSVPGDIKVGDYKIHLKSDNIDDYANVFIYEGSNVIDQFILINDYSAVKDETVNKDDLYRVKYLTLRSGNVVVVDGGTSDIVIEER